MKAEVSHSRLGRSWTLEIRRVPVLKASWASRDVPEPQAIKVYPARANAVCIQNLLHILQAVTGDCSNLRNGAFRQCEACHSRTAQVVKMKVVAQLSFFERFSPRRAKSILSPRLAACIVTGASSIDIGREAVCLAPGEVVLGTNHNSRN
jgi:hypothetical protein